MKLSDLQSMLKGSTSPDYFKSIIFDEMKEYILYANHIGKNRPVFVNEDIDLIVGEMEFEIICKAFLNDDLSELQINYIADALLLSNRVSFKNVQLSDHIGYLTDPEINGPLTKDDVRRFLQIKMQ